MAKRFVIFNVSEINKIDFGQVLQDSATTLRKSVDGTKTFVKWEGETPACIAQLTTKSAEYTYEQMLTELDKSDWLTRSDYP
jgi:uncharacterized protein YjbK